MSAQAPVIRAATAADADWIAARHTAHYTQHEGFDDTFGLLVAQILDAFFANHDPERERGWIAEGDRRLGSVFCVQFDEDTARLRLFLIEPEARRLGLGRRLLDTCKGFARAAGYRRITLWTHESHRAACRLYAADGFACIESRPVHSFGQDLVEQRWTREL